MRPRTFIASLWSSTAASGCRRLAIAAGAVAYMQKKYAAAIAALSPFAEQMKSAERRAEAQFLIGASQFYQDKFAAAAESLATSLKTAPKWRQADEALLLLGRCRQKRVRAGRPRPAWRSSLATIR